MEIVSHILLVATIVFSAGALGAFVGNIVFKRKNPSLSRVLHFLAFGMLFLSLFTLTISRVVGKA